MNELIRDTWLQRRMAKKNMFKVYKMALKRNSNYNKKKWLIIESKYESRIDTKDIAS